MFYKFLEYKTAPTAKPNYLYFESISLKQHIIATENILTPAIFMLGSSGTAGSNIPPETTVADYFNKEQSNYYAYNLAALQATIVDSIIIFKKGIKYKKPEFVILGISPDVFTDTSGSYLAMSEANHLQGLLPDDIIRNIKLEKKRKLVRRVYLDLAATDVIPNTIITAIRTRLYYLRSELYGDIMDKNISGQKGVSIGFVKKDKDPYRLLKVLQDLCREKNIKLIVYLEPQLWVEKFYDANDFNSYRDNVKQYMDQHRITYFDYVSLIPNDGKYFHDFIHMTPEGYELLGKQLNIDFATLPVQQAGKQ